MTANRQVRWSEVQEVLHDQDTRQVLVANYVVNIGAVEGGAVNLAGRRQQAAARHIRARREPPRILPRPVPGFVDRSREQGLVGQALARRQVIHVHGPGGAGKTALASQAMRAQLPSAYPDGMVYLTAGDESGEDLLQDLFHTFFESDGAAVKVTANDLRRRMTGKQALVVIDDANRLQNGDLAQTLPDCALLIAAREEQPGHGLDVPLGALPARHAVKLLEQHWGPPAGEQPETAAAICQALGHVPLAIVQTARAAAQGGLSPEQVLCRLRNGDEDRERKPGLLALLGGRLSAGEQRVLGALAAPGGSSVGIEALPAISGLDTGDVTQHLSNLNRLGLVRTEGRRLRLASGVRLQLRRGPAGKELQRRAAAYYASRAPTLQHLPRDPDEGNVLAALDDHFQRGQWAPVIAMVRGMDRYLAATGRWDQWRRRLEQALEAAQQLGDRAAEAWAQNQLGVIALGLGQATMARTFFRRALSLRRALSDRAGATVARWNLQMLALPPVPPWRRALGKLASALPPGKVWLPLLLAVAVTVAFLGLVAIRPPIRVESQARAGQAEAHPTQEGARSSEWGGRLSDGSAFEGVSSEPPASPSEGEGLGTAVPISPTATMTPTVVASPSPGQPATKSRLPTVPPPSVNVWLGAGGCGRRYAPHEAVTVSLKASISGRVDVYLVDAARVSHHLFGQRVRAGRTAAVDWNVPETEGTWTLVAVLNRGQARGYCSFSVGVPTPAVRIWLGGDGCGGTFVYRPHKERRDQLTVYVQTSRDGWLQVQVVAPNDETEDWFSTPIEAGQVVSRTATVPGRVGEWTLIASLNEGQASGRCTFYVEEARPTVEVTVVPTDTDTVTPTVTMTPTVIVTPTTVTTPTSTVTPTDVVTPTDTPGPRLEMWIGGGCGLVFKPGEDTYVKLLSNVDGEAKVYLVFDGGLEHLFSTRLGAGVPAYHDWSVWGEGRQLLLAVQGKSEASCSYGVEIGPIATDSPPTEVPVVGTPTVVVITPTLEPPTALPVSPTPAPPTTTPEEPSGTPEPTVTPVLATPSPAPPTATPEPPPATPEPPPVTPTPAG